MIDDARIRRMLLQHFPQIEAHRFEMEEYDGGDTIGAAYFDKPSGRQWRVKADARGRAEEAIADDLAVSMQGWFGRSVPGEGAPVPKRGPGRPRKAA